LPYSGLAASKLMSKLQTKKSLKVKWQHTRLINLVT
jgi:hypothetical protein